MSYPVRLTTIALLVLGAVAISCDARDEVEPPPNLLLISIDTLRADHLGSYGYPRQTSPRLDAFARGGTRFHNTFSSSSWTVPAHMTLFTGLEPPAHGLVDFPRAGRLAESHKTLAQVLRDEGWRTAAFTGGGFISERFGFGQGFETYFSEGRRFITKAAAVTQWLESLANDERFFLFLHGFDVHRPYRPAEPFASRYLPEGYQRDDESPVADRMFPLLEDLAVLVRNQEAGDKVTTRPTDAELKLIVSQYDGEIGLVDELLGGMLDWLRETGRLDNTVVVVVSDHGDEFYEHGAIDHVHTLYEELLRVPWFMVGPGIPAGVVQEQVGLIDVFPTVLETMGVDVPRVQGVSRVPLLRERTSSPVAQAVFGFTGFSEYPYRLASVRTPEWKLIRWSLDGMQAGLNSPREHYTHLFRDETSDFVELFRLGVDPGEQTNVAAEHPAVVDALQDALDQRLSTSQRYLHAPTEARPPNAAELEALRALGYIE